MHTAATSTIIREAATVAVGVAGMVVVTNIHGFSHKHPANKPCSSAAGYRSTAVSSIAIPWPTGVAWWSMISGHHGRLMSVDRLAKGYRRAEAAVDMMSTAPAKENHHHNEKHKEEKHPSRRLVD